jgi:hypothetical protein
VQLEQMAVDRLERIFANHVLGFVLRAREVIKNMVDVVERLSSYHALSGACAEFRVFSD